MQVAVSRPRSVSAFPLKGEVDKLRIEGNQNKKTIVEVDVEGRRKDEVIAVYSKNIKTIEEIMFWTWGPFFVYAFSGMLGIIDSVLFLIGLFGACIFITFLIGLRNVSANRFLGHISIYNEITVYPWCAPDDFVMFLEKLSRSRFRKVYRGSLKRISFGKIRNNSWRIELDMLLTAWDAYTTNPASFREIVTMAKNKEAFKQMMGVRDGNLHA